MFLSTRDGIPVNITTARTKLFLNTEPVQDS